MLGRKLRSDPANFSAMLGLKAATEQRWLDQVDRDLPSILIDHAHCEKKAAGTAMNLLVAYGSDRPQICRELSEIVVEELEHFRLVLDLLDERGLRFTSQKPSPYGRQLNDLVGKTEPARAIDRMLVASLIEARSCERFSLLRDHVADRQLAEFYGSLFESEARHHSTYVQLARHFGDDDAIRHRLEELAAAEARIVCQGDAAARMHS
jgi:tRNA-(ms[2]io[6]A)-hydroxylase